MGQQHRKVIKRRRRKQYLKRKKELARTNEVLSKKSGKSDSAEKPVAKKAAKKAAKKSAAKVAKKATKKGAKKKSAKKAVPTQEEIADLAHTIFVDRMNWNKPGDCHGDWIEAERRLKAKK